MLPDFPRSKHQLRKRIAFAIEQSVLTKAPLLAEIKTLVQHEGQIHSYDRVGAKRLTEGYREIAIPVSLEIAEIPDLVGPKLAAKIDEIATEKARAQMDMLYQRHSKDCEEIGNSVNANGAALNADLFLQMLEKVDIQFGPDDQPMGRFHVAPAIAPILERLQVQPEFQARYQDLMERKLYAWRVRESDRKLVD